MYVVRKEEFLATGFTTNTGHGIVEKIL